MPEDPRVEADAIIRAQAAEYGTYVAKHAIDIDGVRAFNAGDPVPKSHVERGVVDEDQVERTASATVVEDQVERTTSTRAAKATTAAQEG